MRSIFRIPSDDMAGDAMRRVPIHYYQEEGKCGAFSGYLPTTWQGTPGGACRFIIIRRKVNAEHFQDTFRRHGRGRRAARADSLLYQEVE